MLFISKFVEGGLNYFEVNSVEYWIITNYWSEVCRGAGLERSGV